MMCVYLQMLVVVLLVIASQVRLNAAPLPRPREVNALASQLHRLDPNRIAEVDRRTWHPVELVAILGTQRGRHWNFLRDVSYSPDGKRIATLSRDRVSIWDTPSLRFQGILPVEAGFMQFMPEQRGLLTCGKDGRALLWDVSGDKPLSRGVQSKILGVPSANGKKLVTTTSGGINLINTSVSPPKSSEVPLGKGTSLLESAFSPDTRFLATATAKVDYSWLGFNRDPWISEMKLTLWDVSGATPKARCSLPLIGSHSTNGRFAFSTNGKTLVWGGHIWELSGDKAKFRTDMSDQNESILDCVFIPGTQHAITASSIDSEIFFCLRDMRPRVPRILQTVQLPSYYCAMALAPDAKTLAVAEGSCLRLWPLKGEKISEPAPFYGHTQTVKSLSFGACGNLLATSGEDRSLRLWDLDGSQPHQRLVHKSARASWDSVALSPDGTKLATGFLNGGFTLWEVSRSGLRVLHEYKCGGTILSFSPDSKTLFSSDILGPINVIDVANPTKISASLVAERGGEHLRADAVAVSSDGQTLAVGGGYDLELWQRTDSGWRKRTAFVAHGQVKSLSFCGRGGTLLVGGGCYKKPQVDLFDVSGEKPTALTTFSGLRDVALSVSASSGGHLFAACDETGRVVVWSASGKILHEWTFPGPVHCVSFAPDGYHLALGNGDGTLYILRLADAAKK